MGAPVEFINTTNLTGETHSTIQSWESDTQADLTSATTKVFDHSGKTGVLLANGDTVTGKTSGATATVSFASDPTSHTSISQGQIMLKSIVGTFQSGEQVYKVLDTDYVVISDAGDSVIPVLEMRKADGEITGQEVLIAGSTTNTTNYRMMTGRLDKHDGKAYNSSGVQYKATTTNTGLIDLRESNFIFEWLGLTAAQTGSQVIVDATAGSGNTFILRNCIIQGTVANGSTYAVRLWTQATVIFNNYIYGAFSVAGIFLNNGRGQFYNNTIFGQDFTGGAVGITAGGSGNADGILKNNIVIGCPDNYEASGFDETLSKNNMGDTGDTDIPGTVDKFSSSGVEFVSDTSGSEDLHLKTGAVAINNGVDTSSDGVTIDIDNQSRPAGIAFDIGADEFDVAVDFFADAFNPNFNPLINPYIN